MRPLPIVHEDVTGRDDVLLGLLTPLLLPRLWWWQSYARWWRPSYRAAR